MKVLVDTCVVLDLLQNRQPFSVDAVALFKKFATRVCDGFITAKSMAELYYILRRGLHNDEATRTALRKLLTLVGVLDTLADDSRNALFSVMSDYEDAIAAQTAQRTRMDCIVTRNAPDFQFSPVPVLEPSELLGKLS